MTFTAHTAPRPAPGPPASAAPHAIEVEGLTKTYAGGVEAVRGLDLRVATGQVVGLLGPNGAGKSTTVGMLTTTVAPTSGRASLAGHDVASDPVGARSVSAVVFQEPVVDRPLTGRRNLLAHARLWGLDAATAQRRVEDVIDAFALADVVDRPVGTYSGGQTRRLEIARALVSEPLVLFLDEPTVGLDPRVRHEVLDLVAGLRDRSGTTVLLTTHHLEEAEQLCDRVAIVHRGRVVAEGTPAGLLADLGDEVVEVRVDGDVAAALATLRAGGVAGDDAFTVGSTIHVPLRHGRDPGGREVVAAVAGLDLTVRAVAARPPSLDDVYLRLTGTSLAA